MLATLTMRRIVFFTAAMSLMAALNANCSRPEPATPVVTPTPTTANTATQNDPHANHAQAQQAPSQPTGGTRRFGEALASDATRISLGTVLRESDQHLNQNLRIEGQIVAVCQHMGCWMEIRDDQTQAHVRMHGHSFFLPRDVNGKRAALVGTVVASHPPTQCNGGGCGQTGPQSPIELDAIGVEVYD